MQRGLMRFGIREKVALLVMLATAACALLVSKLLSHKATMILREHEIVDLGDEASLRSWELIDQIDGLRDDLATLAYRPQLAEAVAAGKTPEELKALARSLCRRYWKKHLRIDIVGIGEAAPAPVVVLDKAELAPEQLWFPDADAAAGTNLHISPIQRLAVNHRDLLGLGPVTRTEPVIWAVAPLDPVNRQGQPALYVRVMMTLHAGSSPRHFSTLSRVIHAENGGAVEIDQLVRHDETEVLERQNDGIFLNLSTDETLLAALKERNAPLDPNAQPQAESKVERLVRRESVPLMSGYEFQEGSPGPKLTKILEAEKDADFENYFEQLDHRASELGRLSAPRSGVNEFRLLAQTREKLALLRAFVAAELAQKYGDAYDGIDWRGIVECDEVSSWAVRVLVGNGAESAEYLVHYACLDDELASSIRYEMVSLQSLALAVAAFFGIVGFLIAMHFIRPLRQMTRTALKITESHRENLYTDVGALTRSLDIKRRDEVGDISRASKRLFEELIDSQSELERRVVERTRELSLTNSKLGKANEKLKSLSNEKDVFVAKVSHDLRQPLNAIFLQVEALKLSKLDDTQRKDVQRIRDHAARELNLVNDILEYQKIIMGAEVLHKDVVQVAPMFADIADGLAGQVAGKPVTLSQTAPADLSLIADERRLRQILGNLVGNACKFTKEGSVSFEAKARAVSGEAWIEFTVTDTGRGMSPQEQSQVFVPFVSNKKDNAGGSGLGLSICKELVAQMGGRIGFVSELGKGTHFSVMLPQVPSSKNYEAPTEEVPIVPEHEDPEPFIRSEKRAGTILVIDDDERVRDLLVRILEAEGHQVITASNGESGLALAHQHLPDAITLDVVMPGGRDGWDVLRALKDSADTRAIPVIMVSVLAEQGHGLALDVADYLVKPIDVDRLSRAIQQATSSSPQRNLLLVDDDPDSLEAMSAILTKVGWQTILADNGQSALDALAKTRPAAIILDLMMPEMDGFEFIRALQASAHLRSIPVIVMSGKDPSESEREFLRNRVEAVLRKGPDGTKDLLAAIQTRLRLPRTESA